MRLRVLTPIVLALAAALAGCGGSDEEPLTRQELVRQANALCQASNDRQAEFEEPKDIAGLAASVEPARDDLRQTVDALGKLTPPDEVESDYTKLLEVLRDAEEQFDPLLEAARKQDVNAVAAVVPKINELNEQANAISGRLGLTTCAQS